MPNPFLAAQALSGLQNVDKKPFNPSEMELFELANRDPNTVRPGSNQYWGHELEDQQKDHDILHAQELSDVLNTDRANNAAQIAGFSGNPTYKTGDNSYESHNPSLDSVGPTPMSPSHRPTPSPSGQAAQFQRGLETAKVNSPLDVAREQNNQRSNTLSALQGMLAGGIPEGLRVNLGGGIGVGQQQPRVQPVNNKISAALADAIKRREDLDNPDPTNSIQDWLSTHGGSKLGIGTTDQRRASLDAEIAKYQMQLNNPPSASHVPTNQTPALQGQSQGVMMSSPDGQSRRLVPHDQVEHYKSLGAIEVQGQ